MIINMCACAFVTYNKDYLLTYLFTYITLTCCQSLSTKPCSYH